MKFTIDKHEKYVSFKLNENNLNSLIAPMLKSELILLSTEGYHNIVIDLKDVQYCDSSGLSSLLVAHRLCANSGGMMVLTGLSAAVKKLINISQLDTVLTIVNTISESEDLIFMSEIEKELKGSVE